MCRCNLLNVGQYNKLIHEDEDMQWWACIACYDTWFVGEEE